MKNNPQAACDPTEKTLYTEPHSDDVGTWKDRLYQTGNGIRKGLGIDVAGKVYVMSLKEWHELASHHFTAVGLPTHGCQPPCLMCQTAEDEKKK